MSSTSSCRCLLASFAFAHLLGVVAVARAQDGQPAAGPSKPASALPTVVVLPLQPAQSEVPALVTQRFTELLAQELKSGRVVNVVAVATPSSGPEVEDPGLVAMRQADKAYAEGREKYRKQSYEEAAKAFGASLKLLQDNLASVGDYGFLADVYLWHGLALFRASNEDESKLALERALLVRPDLQIDSRKVDAPVFLNLVEKLRKSLRERARGSLVVATTPPGCELLVNGVLRGKTPVDLRGVPSGWHHLRVSCPGHVPKADAREVKPNAATTVALTLDSARARGGVAVGPDPLPPLLSRLRQGIVNNDTTALAQEIALRAGAELSVLGYLVRQEGEYVLRAYLHRAQDGRLVPLAAVRFDLELLGATQEGARLARSVEKSVVSLPPPERRLVFDPGTGQKREIRTAGDLRNAEGELAREEIERLAREERERRLGLRLGPSGAGEVASPFYKKWWFWALVGGAVGGGVAGALLGTRGGAGTASVGIRWTPP